MSDINSIDAIISSGGAGGIAGGVVAALFVLRKIWMDLSKSRVETTKDNAEVTVVNTLREEVKRLSDEYADLKLSFKADIEAMKEAHILERKELLDRISSLEDQLINLRENHATLKQEALKLYIYLNSGTLCDDCDFTELKVKLMEIILHVENPDKIPNQDGAGI